MITQCARARDYVHVFDFCGDKGVQICISPTFIEPRAFIRE